jgi:S-adenosylmethionine:tRNA ribosyltransferase-isomerase
MRVSDFDYQLPEELIAQEPLGERDASRMMIVDRAKASFHDSFVREFPAYIRAGDVVVLNNTKVFPARLVGVRQPSGGLIELLLLKEIDNNLWEALARPARRLKNGSRLKFDNAEAVVVDCRPDGKRLVRFESEEPLSQVIDRIGQTPLPPYIRRNASPGDRDRYQTIYAKSRGAVAAPTAGLHFTDDLIHRIKGASARVVEITLHVGYGTFEPVRVTEVDKHRVAAEEYFISDEVADIINNASNQGSRIVAIGTTTTRALESAATERGRIQSGAGIATLTVLPGYEFRAVDGLLTNFHLPKSSLLMLVSAFAGRELILKAYDHAVAEAYRFYSYGDCMLIT